MHMGERDRRKNNLSALGYEKERFVNRKISKSYFFSAYDTLFRKREESLLAHIE